MNDEKKETREMAEQVREPTEHDGHGMCLGKAYVHVCAAALKRCALDGRKVVMTRAAHALAIEGQEPRERGRRLDDLLSQAAAALGDDQYGRALFQTTLKTNGRSYSGPFQLVVDGRWPTVTIATPGEDTAQVQFTPELSLLVLHTDDLEASRRFYELLGLSFRRERHGDGPEHWSARMGDLVLELYPRGDGPATRTRLGLRTDRLPKVVELLRAAGFAVDAAPSRPGFAVAVDPDGNRVELYGR